MRDFHNLDVWHKAHRFTLDVFHTSETFPKGEVFQLAATLRRGAMFVAMRIAEACGQDSSVDFAQGLSRARSMGMEVEYALLLAKDLEFLKPELHDPASSSDRRSSPHALRPHQKPAFPID